MDIYLGAGILSFIGVLVTTGIMSVTVTGLVWIWSPVSTITHGSIYSWRKSTVWTFELGIQKEKTWSKFRQISWHLCINQDDCITFKSTTTILYSGRCQSLVQIYILGSNKKNSAKSNSNMLLFMVSIQIQFSSSNTNTLQFFIQIRFKCIAIFRTNTCLVSILVQVYHSGWNFISKCIIQSAQLKPPYNFNIMAYLFRRRQDNNVTKSTILHSVKYIFF